MRPVEQLETRRLLTAFTASSVAELVGDINAANAAGGANTITLTPGAVFNLTSADNDFAWEPTGLPVIAAANDLTIVGNGGTIQRSTAAGTPAFRLLAVGIGGSLTLNDLTLSNGVASPSPTVASFGDGGAVNNQGTLGLARVTVKNCVARGASGIAYPGFGGGIYSWGTLTITDSAIVNNQAIGGDSYADAFHSMSGGEGRGGGVYVGAGTAVLTNTTITSNVARGGNGADGYRLRKVSGDYPFPTERPAGNGGDALGGGVFASTGAAVTLRGTAVTANTATGGSPGKSTAGQPKGANGAGRGGGIYIYSGSSAGLDAFTRANTKNNTASTSDNDIFGSFSILA